MTTISAMPTQKSPERQVQEALESLAKQLDSNDSRAAGRLRRLSEALGDADKADQWAATDVHRMIEPEAIIEKYKSQIVPGRFIGTLEWIRNFSILLPLILTWWGISHAVNAYRDLLNADSTLVSQPFLYLWQQKFNGYLQPFGPFDFTLGSLAFLDFLILLGLLGLTAIVTIKSHVIHVTRELEAEELRGKLADALADASLLLKSRRRQQPATLTDVVENLDKIAKQFETTTQKFLRELEEERKNRGDLTTFTTTLKRITDDMLSAAGSIEHSSVDFNKGIKELLVPVKEIPEQQKRIISSADQAILRLTDIVNSFRNLVSEHNRWRQEVQDILTTSLTTLIAQQEKAGEDLYLMLNSSLTRLQSEQTRLGQQLHDMLGQSLRQVNIDQERLNQELQNIIKTSFTQLISEQNRMGQLLQDMLNRSLGQLITEQGQWGQKFLNAIDSLDITVEQIGQSTSALDAAAKNQGLFVKALENERNEQINLTTKMSATLRDTEAALQAIRNWTPELRSIAVDMNKLVHELKSLPDTLKIELFEALKFYSIAAANVSTSADTLKAAAGSIDQASSSLASATTKLDGRLGP